VNEVLHLGPIDRPSKSNIGCVFLAPIPVTLPSKSRTAIHREWYLYGSFLRSSGKVLNLKIVKLRAHKSPDQFRISLLTRTRPVFLHPCSTSAALTYSTHHGNLKNSPELKKNIRRHNKRASESSNKPIFI
jgi:hypothetical protein